MKIEVNGIERTIAESWQAESLLWTLREHLGLTGTRYSCGKGLCGACTVHINGEPVRSCITPVATAEDRSILTIEGLAHKEGKLHPLQQAWLDERVPQCGYCQSGQILQALSLLSRTVDPDDDEIRDAMNGILCRCGTYDRIRKGIRRAALVLAKPEEPSLD